MFLLTTVALALAAPRCPAGPLVAEVCDLVRAQGQRPVSLKGQHGVEVRLPDVKLVVRVDEPDEIVTVYALLADDVPADRIDDVAAFTTLANRGLPLGAFEADGPRVRYRIGSELPSTDQLELALARARLMTKRYRPAVDAVVAGTKPAVALAAIDGT